MEPSAPYLRSWPRQQPAATDRKAYRPREIAEMYGLGLQTVYDALYAGRLTGNRVGRAWVVAVEDVERWVRGGTAQERGWDQGKESAGVR